MRRAADFRREAQKRTVAGCGLLRRFLPAALLAVCWIGRADTALASMEAPFRTEPSLAAALQELPSESPWMTVLQEPFSSAPPRMAVLQEPFSSAPPRMAVLQVPFSRQTFSTVDLFEDPGQDMDEEDWEAALEGEELGGELGEDPEEDLEALIQAYLEELQGEPYAYGQEEIEKVVDPPLTVELVNGKIRSVFPNGGYFTSTVPQGMTASQPVELSLSTGCIGIVENGGLSVTLTGSRRFTEAGDYQVQILSYQPPEESPQNEDYGLYESHFYFRILGETDSRMGMVPAPERFLIQSVTLDGMPQAVEDPRCFFLKGDGRYEICYRSEELGGMEAWTAFTRDTTAPFLSFSQELGGKDGETVSGMVEYHPSEPDTVIRMRYNGEQGYASGNRLTVAGYYHLVVEDKAGNGREYRLRLKASTGLMDPRIMVGGIILFLLLGAHLFFLRRDMRVS